MSDQEDNMQNNEENGENYEENMDPEYMNQGEGQYEEENMNENGEEEEGQDVFAFDIQINEDLYLLVIGKTDENKLLLRLIDKEDETKPFFQNEFSLEDLRNINPFFNNVDDENIAFHYIISNLNDADKEIKIIDQDKIELILSINEEDEKIIISFDLYKTSFEGEGDEDNQEQEEMMIHSNGINQNENENEGEHEEREEIMEDLVEGEGSERRGVPVKEGIEHLKEGEIDIKNVKKNEENHEENNNNLNNINSIDNERVDRAQRSNKAIKSNNTKLSSNIPLQLDGSQSNVTTTTVEKKEVSNENGIETIIEKKEVTKIINQNQPEIKKEITIIKEEKLEPEIQKEKEKEKLLSKENIIKNDNNNNEYISLMKEELLKTINALSENFNNQLLKQNESFIRIENEIRAENENKLKEIKNELNKKDNDLNDMKNKFENMNKKILDLEKNINENKKIINGYEGKINELNNKINNINEQIKNVNNTINIQIENNNKKIKQDIDNLSTQIKSNKNLLEKNAPNEKNINNIENEKLINDLKSKINEIDKQIGGVKKDIENNKITNDKNMKSFNEKIINLDEKLKQNNNALLNIGNNNNNDKQDINEDIYNKLSIFENIINDIESKIENQENYINNNNSKENQNENGDINNKLNNFENIMNSYGTKIKNLENNLEKIKNLPKEGQAKNQYDEKIIELENITKDIEARINDYDIDQIIQNLSILMEKANETEIYDKINNLETEINQIRQKSNNTPGESKNNIDNNNLNEEIIDRMNNFENIIQSFEEQFQKIEDDNKNNNTYTNTLDKRTINFEKKLSNISKLSEDLQNKTNSLFKMTKNLENINKELDNKINEVMNNMAKIYSSKELNSNTNKNMEKLRNVKKNSNSSLDPRLKQEKNIQSDENRGIQKNIGYNKGNKKINENIIETNNEYQISNRAKENINTYSNTYNNKQQKYNTQNFGESNYYYSIQPGNNTNNNYIDSNIVDYEDIIFLKNRIKEMHPKINNIFFNLVYRASEDGDKAADFHHKCDKIGPNITLIKTKKGFIFGGFTFKNWEHMQRDIDPNKPNLGSASRDSRAFGFSVNNQKIYNNIKPNEFAIWCNRNFGPTFKNNLFQIFDSSLKRGGYCSIKSNSHFGGQDYDYEISGGESRFKIEELEVYEIKLQ